MDKISCSVTAPKVVCLKRIGGGGYLSSMYFNVECLITFYEKLYFFYSYIYVCLKENNPYEIKLQSRWFNSIIKKSLFQKCFKNSIENLKRGGEGVVNGIGRFWKGIVYAEKNYDRKERQDHSSVIGVQYWLILLLTGANELKSTALIIIFPSENRPLVNGLKSKISSKTTLFLCCILSACLCSYRRCLFILEQFLSRYNSKKSSHLPYFFVGGRGWGIQTKLQERPQRLNQM